MKAVDASLVFERVNEQLLPLDGLAPPDILAGGGWPMAELQYVFGPFQLFPERRLLLEAGVPLKLGPRAFDLLAVLVKRSGEIVSQAELMKLTWPHATVDTIALRVHLSSLRKALQPGNGGRSPILNVSGRGYTLAIPVEGRSSDEEVRYLDDHEQPPTRSNLPVAGKRLVGRDAIVRNLVEKLAKVRLLSIVGPGGVGKTSVALAMAEAVLAEYSGGVAFVDLATMSDPHLLWTVIAAAANIATITEHVQKAVVAALKGRRCLIILDNCEHLVESAAGAAQTLCDEVPTLDVLATSREPLRAEAEHVHRLAPLESPTADENIAADDIGDYSALALLVERATANNESFYIKDEDVGVAAALCRKLDGLPLGIELVAAGVATFGLRTVAANIETRSSVMLKGPRTAAPRHQTLTAVLDWSFDDLTERERTVVKSLGVFQGGIDFQTASTFLVQAEIASDDVVEAIYSLHMKSLLSADLGQEEIQYRLLETTKLYIIGKLRAEGVYDALARRHAEYFRDYFAGAESDWNELSQNDWRRHYGTRLVEVRAAIDWAMSPSGSVALAAEILAETGPLWTELGLVAEYRSRLDAVLQRLDQGDTLAAALMVRVKLEWAKSSWLSLGPTPRMIAVAREALATAEAMGDPADVVEALWLLWDHRTVFGAGEESVVEKAKRLAETSIDPVVQLAALRLIAIDLHYQGEQEQAWKYQVRMGGYSDQTFRRIRRICHRGDQSLGHITLASRMLWMRGFPDQAVEAVTNGVAYAETLNDMSLAYFLGFAACPVALWSGELDLSGRWISQLEHVATVHSLGFWRDLAEGYRLALPLIGKEPAVPAGRALPREADVRFLANQLELFASLHPDMASPSVLALCETREFGWGLPEHLRAKSIGLPEGDAMHLLGRAIKFARSQGALSWELRAATSMAEVLNRAGQREHAARTLETVYARFTEGFSTKDLIAAKAQLSRLEA